MKADRSGPPNAGAGQCLQRGLRALRGLPAKNISLPFPAVQAEMATWKSYSLGLRHHMPSRFDLNIKYHYVQNKLRSDHAVTRCLAFIYACINPEKDLTASQIYFSD